MSEVTEAVATEIAEWMSDEGIGTKDAIREYVLAMFERCGLFAADDEEPVQLGAIYEDRARRIRIGVVGVGREGAFISWCGDDEAWLCDVKTKGDVRRLLAALKIKT